jgi:hypothetical protein
MPLFGGFPIDLDEARFVRAAILLTYRRVESGANARAFRVAWGC